MIPGSYPPRQLSTRGKGPLSPLKKLFSIGVVIAALTFIIVNRQGLIKLRRLQRDQQAFEAKLIHLRSETDRLQTTRAQLEVDLVYIEQLAREKYRMVRKGEKIFRVAPRQKRVDPAPADKN